jgi:hypothetical protein
MARPRSLMIAIVIAAIACPIVLTSASAQMLVSKKGKIRIFKGNLTVEGRDLEVNGESVSLTVGGQPTFLDLREIDRVDVKHGNAMKGACIGGGGCMTIGIVACTASSEEDLSSSGGSRGQCYAGTMIWASLAAGVGALIGKASEDWETIYYRSSSGLIEDEVMTKALEPRADRTRMWLTMIPPRDCCPGAVGISVEF